MNEKDISVFWCEPRDMDLIVWVFLQRTRGLRIPTQATRKTNFQFPFLHQQELFDYNKCWKWIVDEQLEIMIEWRELETNFYTYSDLNGREKQKARINNSWASSSLSGLLAPKRSMSTMSVAYTNLLPFMILKNHAWSDFTIKLMSTCSNERPFLVKSNDDDFLALIDFRVLGLAH